MVVVSALSMQAIPAVPAIVTQDVRSLPTGPVSKAAATMVQALMVSLPH